MTRAKEIDVTQGTEAWRSLRHGFISPSRFRTVLTGRAKGLNSYLRDLRAKTRRPEVSAPALAWGKYHEDQARGMYQLISALTVRTAGFFIHNTMAHVGGSPDGIVLEEPAGIEIKCPYSSEIHLKTLRYGVPRDHLFQIQGYLWLTEAAWWDFVSFDPRCKKEPMFIQRILPDEKLQRDIEFRVAWFHEVLVSGADVEEQDLNELIFKSPSIPKFF